MYCVFLSILLHTKPEPRVPPSHRVVLAPRKGQLLAPT